MTRVTRVTVDRSCAICERTLLMGERAVRFSPNGGNDYVDVCPLCQETAVEYGWIREGAPTSPTVSADRRRRRGSFLAGLLGSRAARAASRRSRRSRSCAVSRSTSLRWSRRPTSSTPPSTAARSAGSRSRSAIRRLGRRPLGRQRRGRRHRRVGHLLVPVPRHARLRATRCGSKERGPRPVELEASVHRVERAHGRRRPDRPRHRAPVDAAGVPP